MKKYILFSIAALATMAAGAEVYNYITVKTADKTVSIPLESVQEVCFTTDDMTSENDYTLRVLTFEDADYRGNGNYLGNKDWSSLIDSKEYAGELLYNDFTTTPYRWHDEGNTELAAAIDPESTGCVYWSGGEAISNYICETYATEAIDYQRQLSTAAGGHNGSSNFCVHNGYFDGVYYTAPSGGVWFADGVARVIDHMYVTLTAYGLSSAIVGSAYCPAATETDWVTLTAIGTDAEGNTHELSLPIAANGNFNADWQRWDLAELGAIVRLDFNISSSMVGDWGMNFPAYFAYDDIAVRFPNE